MTKKLDKQKLVPILIVVALVLIVALFVALSGEKNIAGEAFFVELSDLPDLVDLLSEESMIFSRLPSTAVNVSFSTAVDFNGLVSQEYVFSLIPVDSFTYTIEIYDDNDQLVVFDTLDVTGDSSSLYLDTDDVFPDLEVAIRDGQVLVTNLHFAPPDLFNVEILNNNSGVDFGRVVRVNASNVLGAKINTSGPDFPEVEFNILPMRSGLENIYNATLNVTAWGIDDNLPDDFASRTFNLSWRMLNGEMVENDQVALLLNVTSDISGGRSSKYFTIASGNRTYDKNDSGYPSMLIDFTDLDHQGRTAMLTVTFSETNDLQPFALPCKLSSSDANLYSSGSESGFLAMDNVAAIYGYDSVNALALQSLPGPIGEITRLRPFEAYFVRLADPSGNTEFVFDNCEVEDPRIVTRRGPPSTQGNVGSPTTTHRIREGWNLFSMPGVVPTSLRDIVPSTARFELFECQIGEVCNRLNINNPLHPGRAYWVYSNTEFIVSIQ
jgi:hypothetical protein